MRMRRYGESAVLVDVGDLDGVTRLLAAVAGRRPAGVAELIPAARTLLVTFDPRRTDHQRLAGELRAAADAGDPATVTGAVTGTVEIPVVYDGPDLAEVAEHCGLTEAEVVRRHGEAVYTVAFGGFAPGFAYLRGLDPRLTLGRRASPRTSVPAGAVAIAGEWSAVYPTASPGGWRLLGRTDVAVWDTDRQPPSLLVPGTRVRFRPAPPGPRTAPR